MVGAALLMRVPTRVQLLGYPALAILMFLLGAGLGVALILSALRNDRPARPTADKDPL
jgi:hypothetical protein